MSSLSRAEKKIAYQYLQIELTSRCNLSCQTCIRAQPDIGLREQDLSFSALQRLQPALQHTASVHLQGLGGIHAP